MRHAEQPTAPGPATAAVRSCFADDPDYRELLEWFVGSLPEVRDVFCDLFQRGDYDGLRTRAHQVKGSGGGYGFPELSLLAAELEDACGTRDPVRIVRELHQLLAYVERIVL